MTRLSDPRHTAATLGLTAGVPPKVVSEQLGHASAAFTLDLLARAATHAGRGGPEDRSGSDGTIAQAAGSPNRY
jgi:integrase